MREARLVRYLLICDHQAGLMRALSIEEASKKK